MSMKSDNRMRNDQLAFRSFLDSYDASAVHLRGLPRKKSKRYPWNTFCRKTFFEEGSENLTDNKHAVTCRACCEALGLIAPQTKPKVRRVAAIEEDE